MLACKIKAIKVNLTIDWLKREKNFSQFTWKRIRRHELTVWNLNAINGRTKSNQFVIFLPTSSGRMTSNEFPMLRTTISDLGKHPNRGINSVEERTKKTHSSNLTPKRRHFHEHWRMWKRVETIRMRPCANAKCS